jgi:hypothetical protein
MTSTIRMIGGRAVDPPVAGALLCRLLDRGGGARNAPTSSFVELANVSGRRVWVNASLVTAFEDDMDLGEGSPI